jgi:hypothetical protein
VFKPERALGVLIRRKTTHSIAGRSIDVAGQGELVLCDGNSDRVEAGVGDALERALSNLLGNEHTRRLEVARVPRCRDGRVVTSNNVIEYSDTEARAARTKLPTLTFGGRLNYEKEEATETWML